MNDLPVDKGTRVTLHFALRIQGGEVVDSTFDKDAPSLEIGDGNLPENFEAYLMGMKAGDRKTVVVPPEKGFGQHNPSNIQTFKRHDFSADMVLEPGVVVSFADARQQELPGVVTRVEGDEVDVDFNHPLAGRTLEFEVAILDVEPVGTAH
ncbi:peptidylprolyl isomerase [Marinobacter lutaoensis]|jgi:FKBP-type peptidyl-prolyl cis-trans isomerase SlpA|uniref:Peptidyl-prolyl cis-trans isomerase n=1 Tax=Marinobacter lutaoensis TaxID=135739 RepID=A0A1V2DVF2_9GAMM|nr:peptidylprolyl isomerase [Marinobacter lutaoensis]MBE03233.1 peptidylprolyl isomerase [Marinobacter sp.]MBI44022.1 peptidylprolyl isomerase [Oceanospirillales bacterium]NVD35617.1 peptidylprolyl isomerase [Marinobacter lutaoensis]ONF44725.1 peptidylprolyl isomerase [Marinobacter lutaoensis]|tara:strand:- start:8183 stop:8635 length:453 start_codon:yes stop_codon:yes gene_type:complete